VETTELPVHEEEWQCLSLGESPDIPDEGDTSTRDKAGEAVKLMLRLRGGCRLSDECSIGNIDEDDLSSHGSTPSMHEGVMSCHSGTPSVYEGDSSDEDVSVDAIADAPPTLVDDVDSSDDESSECDVYEERTMMIGDERVMYLKTNASWDEDECMARSERQTTLQWSVSREFFDADGLRSDRVQKREARLQEILKEGLSYDLLCQRWYIWLASLSHEEHLQDKESAESIEMVNLNTKETPTPPSTPHGNS
jgi:hypothetical protein